MRNEYSLFYGKDMPKNLYDIFYIHGSTAKEGFTDINWNGVIQHDTFNYCF